MHLKHDAISTKAVEMALRLKAIDYELISLCTGQGCPLTLKAAERLVRMQRSIRDLRYQIELEGGFDLDGVAPRAKPGGWSPTLRPLRGPAGGGAR